MALVIVSEREEMEPSGNKRKTLTRTGETHATTILCALITKSDGTGSESIG